MPGSSEDTVMADPSSLRWRAAATMIYRRERERRATMIREKSEEREERGRVRRERRGEEREREKRGQEGAKCFEFMQGRTGCIQ